MAAAQDYTSEMCNLTQAQGALLANYRKINQIYYCTRRVVGIYTKRQDVFIHICTQMRMFSLKLGN